MMGFVRRLQGRFDEAVNEGEAAIRLNPNLNSAHYNLGWAKVYSGRGEEALPHFADAIRLGPRDPFLFLGYYGVGCVRFLLGDDDRAIEELRKAIALTPTYPGVHLVLAAAYGMQGRADEASAALAAYFRTGPTAGTIALVRAQSPSNHPVFVAQRQRIYEGLHRAGMLEQ
jgi:tetratricopeptide (TPR) repeat protein